MFILALVSSLSTMLTLILLSEMFTPTFKARELAPTAASWEGVREALREPAPVATLFNPTPAALAHWADLDAKRLAALHAEIELFYQGVATPLFPAAAPAAPAAPVDTTAVTRAAGQRAHVGRVVHFYHAGASAGAVVERADGTRVSGLVKGLSRALRCDVAESHALALSALG